MFRIAVCEDSTEDMDIIRSYLQMYLDKTPEKEILPAFYNTPMLLKEDLDQGRSFGIYILDMLMPGTNGIELARYIRKTDAFAPIIYITATRDYALEAFGVHAIRYLIKPVKQEEFDSAVDFALQLLVGKREEIYYIKTKKNLIRTHIGDIVYVENISRQLSYHLADGAIVNVSNRESFEKHLEALIQHSSFLRPHKSFLVNMSYIRSISNRELLLDDGTLISISRSNIGATRSRYLQYLAKKDRWGE